MNLLYVESFYWVARLENLSAAAKKLFITQSAMSARIRALETDLGVQLLDRRVKRVRLTPGGARFLGDAARLLASWREIKAGLGTGPERTVSLRVGAVESVLHSWLIPWIEHLRKEHRELELELTVETTPVLLDLVRRGALQLAMAALPVQAEGVRTRALPPMPMAFVGKQGLHRRRKYTLQQLAGGELLTFQRGSQPHNALVELLRTSQIEDARVHTISSISAMVRLVSGGFGVATLPHAAIHHLGEAEGLRRLPCDVELVPLPIHASWRADPASNAIDAVAESAAAFAEARARMRPSSKI